MLAAACFIVLVLSVVGIGLGRYGIRRFGAGVREGVSRGERTAALDILGGSRRGTVPVVSGPWGNCSVCGDKAVATMRLCSSCDSCSEQHQHAECGNCHWKWIIKP